MNLFLETFKEQPFHKQCVLYLFVIAVLFVIALLVIYAWLVVAIFGSTALIVWGIVFTCDFLNDYKKKLSRH